MKLMKEKFKLELEKLQNKHWSIKLIKYYFKVQNICLLKLKPRIVVSEM